MDNYYSMLMQFTQGTTPCRNHLVKKFSEALVESAIEKGYIIKVGETDIGDPKYAITNLGKKIRDK